MLGRERDLWAGGCPAASGVLGADEDGVLIHITAKTAAATRVSTPVTNKILRSIIPSAPNNRSCGPRDPHWRTHKEHCAVVRHHFLITEKMQYETPPNIATP
jgi:hypothetical protein